MTEVRAEYDSPWKQAIEDYFSDFLLFFFPDIHGDIDWGQGYEFLDQELQKIVRDAELGKRFSDKLIKVWRISGDEVFVLIHVEVQGQPDPTFKERMFVYNYRIRDRYQKPVESLAVLADERSSWRPSKYRSQVWCSKTTFEFASVKLLDYGQQLQRD